MSEDAQASFELQSGHDTGVECRRSESYRDLCHPYWAPFSVIDESKERYASEIMKAESEIDDLTRSARLHDTFVLHLGFLARKARLPRSRAFLISISTFFVEK